jgi:GH15 family glucan-1,4-alpha-glucosidase
MTDKYPPIGHYAIIGCSRSAALISLRGSIDWLCWPRFDSPSVFARILDYERGGYFAIRPSVPFRSKRRYLDSTNVLETTMQTDSGTVKLLDLMPVMRESEKRSRLTPFRQILRRIECVSGEVPMEVDFSPRMNYARASTPLRFRAGSICVEQGPIVLNLRSDVKFDLAGPDATARFTMHQGEQHDFALGFDDHSPAVFPCIGAEATAEIDRSIEIWREWSSQCSYDGPYRQAVIRSALVLKLLAYAPSGAIVAAPTTSLP